MTELRHDEQSELKLGAHVVTDIFFVLATPNGVTLIHFKLKKHLVTILRSKMSDESLF